MITDKDGNEIKEQEWEERPWNSEDNDKYALWISRKNYNKGPEVRAYICLSNQGDCAENIDLRTVEEIDQLIAALTKARAWLAEQK